MNYQELMDAARKKVGPYCHACPVCDGRACGAQMPGPGAKGFGDTAMRNFQAWQQIRINMNTISDGREPDPGLELFGQKLKYPLLAGPVGAVNLHYGDSLNDVSYNDILVSGCRDAGIAAFTGDGTDPGVMEAAAEAIRHAGGIGIPTIKPWDMKTIEEKMGLVEESGAFAVAMDVDAAGLPFLQGKNPPAGPKDVSQLREIARMAGRPFIVKGIMTVKGALAAKEAGAAAIVVSNHGGRVQEGTPATAEVLGEIRDAIGRDMMILVDGGIRSGTDVYKALALGANAVLIARPFVTAVYGGGREGIALYVEKIGRELVDTMKMCGVSRLDEITRDCLHTPASPYIHF